MAAAYTDFLRAKATIAPVDGFDLDPADQDRFEADPVPVFRVTGREVTTTVYEVAEDDQ